MLIALHKKNRDDAECTDPARLVGILYHRALRDLKDAADFGADVVRSQAAKELLVHAQCILRELHESLNYKQGGHLAFNLGRLYEYMQLRLLEIATGEADDPPARVSEVIGLLETLCDAWSTVANKSDDGPEASAIVQEAVLVA